MGYTSDFTGEFTLDKPLKAEHAVYLHKFSDTRRMKRDAKIAETLPDPARKDAGLPIGDDGAYFVGGLGFAGQDNDKSVLEHNDPAESQPGLWCHWVPNASVEAIAEGAEATAIEWDGGEKFYNYVEWLEYLIENFLAPWGYVLNGEVNWAGEDPDDLGLILVKGNKVKALKGRIVYGDEGKDNS